MALASKVMMPCSCLDMLSWARLGVLSYVIGESIWVLNYQTVVQAWECVCEKFCEHLPLSGSFGNGIWCAFTPLQKACRICTCMWCCLPGFCESKVNFSLTLISWLYIIRKHVFVCLFVFDELTDTGLLFSNGSVLFIIVVSSADKRVWGRFSIWKKERIILLTK